MQLPNTLIEKAAVQPDDPDARLSLQCIQYHAETNTFRSANGFIAAFVPASESTISSSFLIPPEAIAYYRECEKEGHASITLLGKQVIVNSDLSNEQAFDLPDTNYPRNLKKIIPDPDGMEHVFTIDVDLLYRLAQAICPRKYDSYDNEWFQPLHVNVYMRDAVTPIVVQATERNDFVGVLMLIHNRTISRRYKKPSKK